MDQPNPGRLPLGDEELGDALRHLHFSAERAPCPKEAQARYLLLQAFLEGASELDNVARLHLEGLIGECRQRLDRLMVDDAIVAEELQVINKLQDEAGGVLFDVGEEWEPPSVVLSWETRRDSTPAQAGRSTSQQEGATGAAPPQQQREHALQPIQAWHNQRGRAQASGRLQQVPTEALAEQLEGSEEAKGGPAQPWHQGRWAPGAENTARQSQQPDNRMGWQKQPQRLQQGRDGGGRWSQPGNAPWRQGEADCPAPSCAVAPHGPGALGRDGRKRGYDGHPRALSGTDGHRDRWGTGHHQKPDNGTRQRWGCEDGEAQGAKLAGRGFLDAASDEDMDAKEATGGTRTQGGMGGFSSARDVLVADLRKKGQNMASMCGSQPAPRMGLSRGGRRGGAGGDFVPPFVRKGMEAMGGHQQHPGRGPQTDSRGGRREMPPAGGGCHGGGGADEGVLSARTLELLAGPDGELPEELARLDQHLVEQVCNEVMHSGGLVQWDDIAGQDHAKQLVQEMVVWPMMNPHIFKGARAPPKGLLLFGPPGTGKTLIGKAIASNIQATFFNISASSLTSKWIGQGEKMVRTLFAVATALQPAVIFVDEIDSLLSARKSDGEHESSRRLKTEMLVQMEGCDPASTDRRVLLVGATNRPEELDEAARRRMPKQLYIPLPCAAARQKMVQHVLGSRGTVRAELSEQDLCKIVAKTAGYSGSDMRNLIQEACQGPVRAALGNGSCNLSSLSEKDLRPVNLGDFAVAARAQRRTVSEEEVVRYETYNDVHGAKLVSQTESQEDIMAEDNW